MAICPRRQAMMVKKMDGYIDNSYCTEYCTLCFVRVTFGQSSLVIAVVVGVVTVLDPEESEFEIEIYYEECVINALRFFAIH
jgi:hypothetical protein